MIASLAIVIFGFVIGTVIGSFMGAILIRWPKAESVLRGRSACDNCGKTLGLFELIPIVSFLGQRGKCRACGAAIEDDLFRTEFYAGLVGALAGLITSFTLPATVEVAVAGRGLLWAAGTGVFGWLLLLLAILDLRHFWLPDRLTATLAVLGLLFALIRVGPMLEARLIGGLAGYTSLWLVSFAYRHLRSKEGMGAGDPKLFGAIGLWVGWQALPPVLLGATVVGLVVLLVQMARGNHLTSSLRMPLGSLLAGPAFVAWLAIVVNSVS